MTTSAAPETADRPLRTVVWSTGTIGRHAIAGIDRHPALELVGVWVSNPAKDGQDAGRLAGLDRDLGVLASTDREAVLGLEPDVVVHTAMADDRVFECIEDLVSFLEAGIDVVSSGPVLLQWPERILPPEMLARIDEVCARTGASLYVNGIDPGFANDVMPLVLSSLSQRIDHVRMMEICNYDTYTQDVVMNDLFGFGKPLDFPAFLWQPGILTMAWGSCVRLVAAGLGLVLDDELVEEVDRRPAERSVSTHSVEVAEGTMGAVNFKLTGTVDGVPRVTLEHITRTADDQVPEWDQWPGGGGGGYRVEITGEPYLRLDLTHHGEHGDHNVSGMITTAMRIVNAAPHVVAARPGIVTALDLPLVTGRCLVATA